MVCKLTCIPEDGEERTTSSAVCRLGANEGCACGVLGEARSEKDRENILDYINGSIGAD